VDREKTAIFAQFPGKNPNTAQVEINRRQTVFYPSKTGINWITVRGFVLENAATNWAPPTAEQMGLIGPHWSRGWIIEDNEIRHSRCAGVSLGKYGDRFDNGKPSAEAYHASILRALKEGGWNKEQVGDHIVRRNHIHHCGQNGIVGSMGCAFSQIVGNDIHDINLRQTFTGAEVAAIKFHGPIDVEIRDNHIHHSRRWGIWLDWMVQGARVSGNLIHDNLGDGRPFSGGDLCFEAVHGPITVDHNILLSDHAFNNLGQGGAFAHNLIAGTIYLCKDDHRKTPFHKPHDTAIAGNWGVASGDMRFLNNWFVAPATGEVFDPTEPASVFAGNVYAAGAKPSEFDSDALVKPAHIGAKLIQKEDDWYLQLSSDAARQDGTKRQTVTTARLGKVAAIGLPWENADGSPMTLDTDYFGRKRSPDNSFPGPFETPVAGEVKVWPK
jgi:alpha-N-arabinofuranosidase